MDYIKVIQDIIAIDTTVPPGNNYEKAIDYLLPFFKKMGFTGEKLKIPEDDAEGRKERYALVAHRRQAGKPRLIFYAHVDVVPAEGWDAFHPIVKDGKVFGRGAADMKGGLVGLLYGMYMVKNSTWNFDVSVMVTTDEEYSQAGQLRYLAKFLQPVAGANVFSLDSSAGFVSIAGLGLLQINLSVKGKSVHSGMAHLGENAVEKAVPMLQSLLKLKKKIVARQSQVRTNSDTGLRFMESRLNINMIKGGIKTNIIPDYCRISIDRRLIPEENLAEAEKEIMDTLRAVPDVKWDIESVFRIPTIPPSSGDIVDKLAAIIKGVTGTTGQYGEMGSGDLSAVVALDWKGKDFGLGVIRPECNIHGKDEFAYLKDIEDLGVIVSKFLTT